MKGKPFLKRGAIDWGPGEGRLLRAKQVADELGICRASVYNYVAQSLLPPPIQSGPNAVTWFESWIDLYKATRPTVAHYADREDAA